MVKPHLVSLLLKITLVATRDCYILRSSTFGEDKEI